MTWSLQSSSDISSLGSVRALCTIVINLHEILKTMFITWIASTVNLESAWASRFT